MRTRSKNRENRYSYSSRSIPIAFPSPILMTNCEAGIRPASVHFLHRAQSTYLLYTWDEKRNWRWFLQNNHRSPARSKRRQYIYYISEVQSKQTASLQPFRSSGDQGCAQNRTGSFNMIGGAKPSSREGRDRFLHPSNRLRAAWECERSHAPVFDFPLDHRAPQG